MTAPTGPSRNRPDRPKPSDILFVILCLTLMLSSAFVLGGLAAHPFAG